MGDLGTLCDRIATLFQTSLNLTVPSIDTDLFESGILDSLTFVTFLVQFEEDFGLSVSIDDLEFDNFRSVARIAVFLASRNGARAATA
jgi:D-alanine--poly(phosphoribitol) ligase subunit 2